MILVLKRTPKLIVAIFWHLYFYFIVSVSICTQEKNVSLGHTVMNLFELIIFLYIFFGMLAPARCGAYGQLKGILHHISFQRSQPFTACCVPLDTTSIPHNRVWQIKTKFKPLATWWQCCWLKARGGNKKKG